MATTPQPPRARPGPATPEPPPWTDRHHEPPDRPPQGPEGETLEGLLRRLKIETWDVILVGDGSGQAWAESVLTPGVGVGWACVLLESSAIERRLFFGGANDGTVNIGEAMAYLLPLCWLADRDAKQHAAPQKTGKTKSVHIITDSDYLRFRGNTHSGAGGPQASPGLAAIWAGLETFHRRGYTLHWHHLPRNDAALNRYVDDLSRRSRLCLKAGELPKAVDEGGLVLHELNPWE